MMIVLTSKLCGFHTCSHMTGPASLGIGSDNSGRQYRRRLSQLQQALTVGSRDMHVTLTPTIVGGEGARDDESNKSLNHSQQSNAPVATLSERNCKFCDIPTILLGHHVTQMQLTPQRSIERAQLTQQCKSCSIERAQLQVLRLLRLLQ